jgi:IS5 family transposase
VTHKQGLMVGVRSFPGNPYDGHVLDAQLEQTRNLLQDVGPSPKQVVADLGYRGVDAENPGVQIIHRSKYAHEKRLLVSGNPIIPKVGVRSLNSQGRLAILEFVVLRAKEPHAQKKRL